MQRVANMFNFRNICLFFFHVVYFSMLWMLHHVKEEKLETFNNFIVQTEASNLYGHLREAGAVLGLSRIRLARIKLFTFEFNKPTDFDLQNV